MTQQSEEEPLHSGVKSTSSIAHHDESTQSEREEALWGQVVLLQYRNDKLKRDIELRDELISLLREKLARQSMITAPAPVKTLTALPTLAQVRPGTHCAFPGCENQLRSGNRYCSRRHAQQHRWDLKHGKGKS